MSATKQPRPKSSLLPFDIAVERTDPTVTAFAGLPLALEAWHALGLDEVCEEHVNVKTRRRGLRESEWVELLVMLRVAGGRTPADLTGFAQDAGLARLWPLAAKVSPRAVYQFLERFHDPELVAAVQGKAVIHPETPGLRGLGLVNRALIAAVQAHNPQETATLDLDASIQASSKRSALYTYEGGRGFQPTAIYWAEQQLVVHDELRDGNVPAGMGQLEVTKAAFDNLPESVTRRFFRADSASYDHRLLRWLDREDIGFAVTADMSPALRAKAKSLPEASWMPLRKRFDNGLLITTEKQVAEIEFVPSENVSKKGERPFRYLVLRVPKQPELPLHEDSDTECWRHFAICSNRWALSAEELVWWARERCGTVEKVHDLLKNEQGCASLPSQHFGANAAWYRLGVIAYNLMKALEHVCLPEELEGHRPETLRFKLIRTAGRVVRHARTHVLILSAAASWLVPLYVAARAALAQIDSS